MLKNFCFVNIVKIRNLFQITKTFFFFPIARVSFITFEDLHHLNNVNIRKIFQTGKSFFTKYWMMTGSLSSAALSEPLIIQLCKDMEVFSNYQIFFWLRRRDSNPCHLAYETKLEPTPVHSTIIIYKRTTFFVDWIPKIRNFFEFTK